MKHPTRNANGSLTRVFFTKP